MLTLSFNPIWSMVDLNGLQLDNTYYLFTLQNTLPYLFQPIWQDPDMNVSWSDPIQFLANGTLPYNMYWDDTLVYRLEVRQGNTQSAPLIYLIENYIPEGGSDEPVGTGGTTDNQITNPQFVEVSFPLVNTPQLQITTASTTTIAPGWQIVTTGTGSLNVNVIGFSGISALPSNAPFAISIANLGFSSITLRQTFSANGALWTSQAVSFSMVAYASSPTTINVALDYSNGQSIPILTAAAIPAVYDTYSNAVIVGASTNTNVSPAASSNLDISWTGNVTVNLTNIQLIGEPEPVVIQYEQTSVERQIDQTFHTYLPQIENMQIPSYALGWDFKYNPCQELGPTIAVSGLGANTARYIADQTIAFESVGNALSYTISNKGLSFSTTTLTQFALIQYLDANTAFELLSAESLAVQISGTGTNVNGYVSVYWSTAATLPNPPLSTNHAVFFSSLTLGIPTTLASDWTIVPNPYGIAVGGVQSNCVPFALTGTNSLTGWAPPAAPAFNSATFFAIVVSFQQIPITAVSYIDYITLNAGSIATPPSAMNFAETLQGLQYYYESSYDNFVIPGSTTQTSSSLSFPQNTFVSGGNLLTVPSSFNIVFNTEKRSISPIMTLYNPLTGSNSTLECQQFNNATPQTPTAPDQGNWTEDITGSKTVDYAPNTGTTLSTTGSGQLNGSGVIRLHYTSDARFGQV